MSIIIFDFLYLIIIVLSGALLILLYQVNIKFIFLKYCYHKLHI